MPTEQTVVFFVLFCFVLFFLGGGGGGLLSFTLSLHFGRVMFVSCDWLHFCFFARVLNRKVFKTTVIQPLVPPDLYNKRNSISAIIRMISLVPLFSFTKLYGYESAGVIYRTPKTL